MDRYRDGRSGGQAGTGEIGAGTNGGEHVTSGDALQHALTFHEGITIAAVAIFFGLRFLPTGTNLSHMDFRVDPKAGNVIEFCGWPAWDRLSSSINDESIPAV